MNSQPRDKKIKSLIDHDIERFAVWDALHPKDYNGIACPACGDELYDEKHGGMATTLTTSPPRVPVHCSGCSYHGSRLA